MSQSSGHRRSIRLRGYDYSLAGLYFLTLCAQGRRCLFGDVVDGTMRLNALGEIIAREWMHTADIRPEMKLDAFVVMPNHLHGLVWIIDIVGAHGGPSPDAPIDTAGASVGAHGRAPAITPANVRTDAADVVCGAITPTDAAGASMGAHGRAPLHRPPRSLGSFVAGFKSATTKRINAARGMPGHPVWQRNYWDHIVRDDRERDTVRRYIARNPTRWADDRLYVGAHVAVTPHISTGPPVGAHGGAPAQSHGGAPDESHGNGPAGDNT